MRERSFPDGSTTVGTLVTRALHTLVYTALSCRIGEESSSCASLEAVVTDPGVLVRIVEQGAGIVSPR